MRSSSRVNLSEVGVSDASGVVCVVHLITVLLADKSVTDTVVT